MSEPQPVTDILPEYIWQKGESYERYTARIELLKQQGIMNTTRAYFSRLEDNEQSSTADGSSLPNDLPPLYIWQKGESYERYTARIELLKQEAIMNTKRAYFNRLEDNEQSSTANDNSLPNIQKPN